MIKFTNDIKQIAYLWNEAFHDSEEDIMFFINNAKDVKCLGYFYNDKLVSMMFLVDSNLGKYIYAACTLNKYKSNGYMTNLLDYCKYNYKNICLIPANEGLINFYKDRQFTTIHDINDLKFNQIKEINDYLFDGCELVKPIVLQYEGDK